MNENAKILVAQGGGPTAVINQSLAGVVLEARRHRGVERVYGARHGVRGIVDEDFVDLTQETSHNLELVANTPGSALGSTRDKPDLTYCRDIFRVLRAHGIGHFFYIGGNDSCDTVRIVSDEARAACYPLRSIHIPKTIDNDLTANDHTPGFPSAARFVAQAFAGANLDNAALPGVYVAVVMGRHAGFLTAASALGRKFPDDGPHLIYLPERAFSLDAFLGDVKATQERFGRCVVAVSEGIHDGSGTPVAAGLAKALERDAHGNMQLSGSGALAFQGGQPPLERAVLVVQAFDGLDQDADRAEQERYVWGGGNYTLSAILDTGGICIDQAYFATQVGKARAVPTLLFRGEGMDGRHAWFGFLDGNQHWQLDAGRFGETAFVTGYTRDPQTWGEISDHELQFLTERFRSTPAFHSSRVHQQIAADYVAARQYAAAIRAAWKAIKFEPRNLDAWATVLDAQAGQGDGRKLVEVTLYQAVAAFTHYPDLEALFSGRLCRSLRARGQLSAADFEEDRVLAKNRLLRRDLELLQAHDRLAQAMTTRPLAENIRMYDKLVDTLGRGAGIEFYDRIVTLFVSELLDRHEPGEARKAALHARAMLYVPRGSQLESEFNQLFRTLSSEHPDLH